MNIQDALLTLKEGCKVLEDLGVRFWLSAGTALGAYRDNFSDDFITRDTDIDVGVYDDKDYQEILKGFTDNGFELYRSYQTKGRWSQLALKKHNILFDIYFFYPSEDKLVNYNESGTMVKPPHLIDNLGTINIRDCPYPIPSPIEEYLEVRYGKNWKTPSGKVAWQETCANLKPF